MIIIKFKEVLTNVCIVFVQKTYAHSSDLYRLKQIAAKREQWVVFTKHSGFDPWVSSSICKLYYLFVCGCLSACHTPCPVGFSFTVLMWTDNLCIAVWHCLTFALTLNRYDLAVVEVERGKFILAEDELLRQEQQLARDKTHAALDRLQKEKLLANQARRIKLKDTRWVLCGGDGCYHGLVYMIMWRHLASQVWWVKLKDTLCVLYGGDGCYYGLVYMIMWRHLASQVWWVKLKDTLCVLYGGDGCYHGLVYMIMSRHLANQAWWVKLKDTLCVLCGGDDCYHGLVCMIMWRHLANQAWWVKLKDTLCVLCGGDDCYHGLVCMIMWRHLANQVW